MNFCEKQQIYLLTNMFILLKTGIVARALTYRSNGTTAELNFNFLLLYFINKNKYKWTEQFVGFKVSIRFI
jgi:hypothetical protein